MCRPLPARPAGFFCAGRPPDAIGAALPIKKYFAPPDRSAAMLYVYADEVALAIVVPGIAPAARVIGHREAVMMNGGPARAAARRAHGD